MLDKSSAIETVIRKLKKVPVGRGLDLRTYKRDRSILILRTGEDSFKIVEDGFAQKQFTENLKGLKKLLKNFQNNIKI